MCVPNYNDEGIEMAQFFNFKEDYFGLTETEIEKNTKLYGLNVYTKSTKRAEKFSYADIFLSPSVLLMFIAIS